jgi:hypothetical protein
VRLLASLLLVSCMLLAASRVARADCMPASPFASADQATRVAVASGAPAGGTVRLTVHQALKGPEAPATVAVPYNPMEESFTAGRRYLVFLGADGHLASCSTIDVTDARGRPVVDAVRGWLAAADDRARTAHLVKVGVAPPFAAREGLAQQRALEHLGASPNLLAAVDATARARLVALVPNVVDERAYALSWVLGRLHATESMPAWIAFLGASHPSANHRPVQDALELMTNRRDPGYTPGRDFDRSQGDAMRAGWILWQSRHGARSAGEVVAIGSRERGAPVPQLTDRASLAAVVRDPRDELARRVALAACDQLLRTPTSAVPTGTATPHDWTRAAAVCTPP